MKRTGAWVIFVITCLLVAPGATNAVDSEWTRATLKGLQGVRVVVEKMAPEEERAGLAQATLQTDVELKLRQAGIRVLSETEWDATPGRPWLYLQVGTHAPRQERSELSAFSIRLELSQRVVLERNAAVSLVA